MNKSIKAMALSLFIISCIICAPAYAKKTEKEGKHYKPKNSQIWVYNDDKKEYIKLKNKASKKDSNIHEVSYSQNGENEGQNLDLLFIAPFGRFAKFYDPDGKVGINYIKRPARDFE